MAPPTTKANTVISLDDEDVRMNKDLPRKKSIGFEAELVQRVYSDKGYRSEEDLDALDDDNDDNSSGGTSQLIKGKSRKGQLAKRQISKFLKRKKKAVAPAIKKVLFHRYTQLFLGVVLMISLFLPDCWTIINPANNMDIFLNVVLLICIAAFVIEIVVMSIVHHEYINTVFFWLDVVGTISIVFDLTWFTNDITSSSGVDPRTLRAARLAKIGAKAARLTRVTKLIKYFHLKRRKSDRDSESMSAENISAKISSILSQRVAALIMTLVILSSFSGLNITDFSASGFLISYDSIAAVDGFSSNEWFNAMVSFREFYREQLEDKELTLDEPVWFQIRGISETNCPINQSEPNVSVEWITTDDDTADGGYCRFDFEFKNKQAFNNIIRYQNKRFATSDGHGRYKHNKQCSNTVPEFAYICNKLTYVDVLFNHTAVAIEEAWRSIIMICIIIFLLLAFTATFNFAVQNLVVRPISRIISHITSTLEVVVVNSVYEMNMDDDGEDNTELSETDVLEKMVDKLSSIVQTSLGERRKEMFAQDIDSDTKAWLTASYDIDSTGNGNDKEQAEERSMLRGGSVSRMTANLPVHVDDLNSFDFDILSVEENDLFPIVLYMFERHALLREFKIESATFDLFIQTVRRGYKSEPQYHGWHHGCDVLHNVYRIYDTTKAVEYMNKMEIMASFVAAIAHDLGHLGVNNTFLVKSKHALALLHNDVSPLENMHASKLYDILRDPSCNIMKHLDEAQWQAARKQILTSILHTDMAFHFDNLKKLEMFEEVNGVFVIEFLEQRQFKNIPLAPCLKDNGNRLLLQESILHAADLGNPVKPFAIYAKWVVKVTEEFFAQGDKEKELGMAVSPMCERSTTNIPNMQLGFMDFIVAPWYLAMLKIFPQGLLPLAENIQTNYIQWAKLRKEEFPSEEKALRDKVAKFTSKFQEIGLEIKVPADCFSVPATKKIQARNSLVKHRSKSKMDEEVPPPGAGSPI